MDRKSASLSISLFLFLLTFAVHAEQAMIMYADGEGFTLVRQGISRYIDLYAEPAEGFLLDAGDMVLTEGNTWLEVEINQSGTLIKIAENTTFSLNSLENNGGIFSLSYGRIRARVQKLTDEDPFWIQGNDTVAGVRGTDFGYNMHLIDGATGRTMTDVYCFEGKVEVVRHPSDSMKEASSVMLGKNEMVSVDSASPEGLSKERVDSDLKKYWEENDFEYHPVEAQSPLEVFHNDSAQLRKGALYTSIAGGAILGTATAIYFLSDRDPSVFWGMGAVSGILLSSAGYFYIRSLILDRQPQVTAAP